MCIALPQLGLGTAGTLCRGIFIEEHFFDVFTENLSDLKGERETWIIAARFDRVDAGARYTHVHSEIGLGPLHLGSEDPEAGLHSSRPSLNRCQPAARTKPSVHKIIMLAGIPNTGLVQFRAHRGLQ